VAPGQQAAKIPTGFLPVIHSRQVSSTAVIALGPSVMIAGIDDPASGNRLEILVSAERFAASADPR